MEFNHTLEAIVPDNAEEVITISGVGGLIIPMGNTAQRPSNTVGLLRYNTDVSTIEVNDGVSWTVSAGSNADDKIVATSENLVAGDYVNIYSNVGIATARKADNSLGREAHGFVNASSTSPANAAVYFEGANIYRSGMTIGARQYLGTAGQTTETPVTTGLHQFLGVALSTTEINTDIAEEIEYA